jgi:hypothetical protein
MTWTITNLIIHVIAGILGAHAAAAAVHDHSFGVVGHTIAGAAGGAVSGILLQTVVATIEASAFGKSSALELVVGEAVMGAFAGAVAMLIVGLVKKEIGQQKSRSE